MKKLSKITESIWSDMQDRSAGKTIRKEDIITTNEDLRYKILGLYKKQGEGDTLDVSSLTNAIQCDDFSYIFCGYEKVKHIIGLEDWDVSNIKDMFCMFWGCKNFNSDLSKWDVSNVENMSGMFRECENFNCDLSKWDVSKVENMEDMFYGCKEFNSDLSKWNVSSVGDMNEMFEGCEKFNSDLSNWNVRSVKHMGSMFCGCKEFNSDLSKWDVSGVKNMNFMFYNCESFNSDLSNWNVSKVGNMEYMFYNCYNFNSDLSNWNVKGYRTFGSMFGNMFDNCKSLKQIPSWYMNEDLNESIWSDMQDRSSGDTIRKEDDITNIKSLVPVDMGGSVLWADNDLSLKDGDCYFSFDEVFELIKNSGWRLPTLEEVAELDDAYIKGSFWENDDRFVFDRFPHQLVFFKKGLISPSVSDKPIDKDYYYCWTSSLFSNNNRFVNIFTFYDGKPCHTPLNDQHNVNDGVTQDTTNGKLCVRLVKDK